MHFWWWFRSKFLISYIVLLFCSWRKWQLITHHYNNNSVSILMKFHFFFTLLYRYINYFYEFVLIFLNSEQWLPLNIMNCELLQVEWNVHLNYVKWTSIWEKIEIRNETLEKMIMIHIELHLHSTKGIHNLC